MYCMCGSACKCWPNYTIRMTLGYARVYVEREFTTVNEIWVNLCCFSWHSNGTLRINDCELFRSYSPTISNPGGAGLCFNWCCTLESYGNVCQAPINVWCTHFQSVIWKSWSVYWKHLYWLYLNIDGISFSFVSLVLILFLHIFCWINCINCMLLIVNALRNIAII